MSEATVPSLAGFLADSARTPFLLGRFDCCLWLADWIKLRRGVDPASHLRGSYSTPLGYQLLARKAGSMAALVGSCVEPAGLRLTGSPRPGDIGVVRAITTEGVHDVGAICTIRGWASLSPAGLLVGPTTPLAAWEV